METIKGAKLEVTVLIDEDLLAELQADGYSDKAIEAMIKKSITLKDIPFRNPVFEIESVELQKYY